MGLGTGAGPKLTSIDMNVPAGNNGPKPTVFAVTKLGPNERSDELKPGRLVPAKETPTMSEAVKSVKTQPSNVPTPLSKKAG
jgi:hypothetical protein